MLGCEIDGKAGVGPGGCVFAVSAYIGGTHGSGVLSRACVCVWLGVGWEVLE